MQEPLNACSNTSRDEWLTWYVEYVKRTVEEPSPELVEKVEKWLLAAEQQHPSLKRRASGQLKGKGSVIPTETPSLLTSGSAEAEWARLVHPTKYPVLYTPCCECGMRSVFSCPFCLAKTCSERCSRLHARQHP